MLFHTQDVGKRLLNSSAPAISSPQPGTQAHFLGFHPRLPLHDTSLDFLIDLETPDSPCSAHLDKAQLLEGQLQQGKTRCWKDLRALAKYITLPSVTMPVQQRWAPSDIRVSALLHNQRPTQAPNRLKSYTFHPSGLLNAIGFS